MNSKQQKIILENLLQRYLAYIPFCPRESFLKLTNEIFTIKRRIGTIDEMEKELESQNVVVFFETKQSKVNF
jgi:hypothetical protein